MKSFKLNLKQYTTIKLIIVVIISMTTSQSIILGNYIIPIMVIALSTAILLYLRKHVKEVMADERDYETGGTAARWTIQIYSWLAVIAMFILYANKNLNPSYEIVASVLAYSTCFLMFTYSIIFRYNQKSSLMKNKVFYIILAVILFVILLIGGLRIFSGEDNWMCENGQWIQHGHPDFPAPTTQCNK
jgi:uncharacterized membrane protein